MATNPKQLTVRRSIAPRFKIFGPRPLITGESAKDYDSLLSEITLALSPENFIEYIFVRDICDLNWEIVRWRRIQATIVENARAAARESLSRVSAKTFGGINFRDFAQQIAEAQAACAPPQAIRQPNKPRASSDDTASEKKISAGAITAEAFKLNIDLLIKFESIISKLESRRDNRLRELDLRRARAEMQLRLVVNGHQEIAGVRRKLAHRLSTRTVGAPKMIGGRIA